MSALAAHAIYAGVAGGTWKPSIFSLGVLPGAKHQSRIDMGPGGCPDGGHPTANSYHRLVPGFEAPVNLVYSQRNRSACVRIPITGSNPNAKGLEFRVPDPSSNPSRGRRLHRRPDRDLDRLQAGARARPTQAPPAHPVRSHNMLLWRLK